MVRRGGPFSRRGEGPRKATAIRLDSFFGQSWIGNSWANSVDQSRETVGPRVEGGAASERTGEASSCPDVPAHSIPIYVGFLSSISPELETTGGS